MPAGNYTFKYAARRGIKELRALQGAKGPLGDFFKSNPVAANQLVENALGPDALKKIMAGRDVAEVGKPLGAGSEGIAYPALGREGFGALKIHDPTAPLYAPNVIEGKRKFIGHDNPLLARIDYELKPRKIRGMDAPAFMHEFVQGRDLTGALGDMLDAHVLEEAVKGYERGGYAPIDVSHHNLKRTRDGSLKAVDFIGAPVDQLIPGGRRAGPLPEGFKEGINAPFFKDMNTVKRVGVPEPLRKRWETPQAYGERVLRGAFGAKQQARKDRSPQAILRGLPVAGAKPGGGAAPKAKPGVSTRLEEHFRAARARREAARKAVPGPGPGPGPAAAVRAAQGAADSSVKRPARSAVRAVREAAPGFFRKYRPYALPAAAALALAGVGTYYATRPRNEDAD